MTPFTRRRALGSLGSLLAASPLLQGQELIGEPPGRIAPRAELVNLFEVEAVAKRKLPGTVYSTTCRASRPAICGCVSPAIRECAVVVL